MSTDDEVRSGVSGMDGEHGLLLRLLATFANALRAGERETAAEVLARLEDFAGAHFLSEQILMRLHAYPGYEAHQAEHDRLVEELRALRSALDAPPPGPPSDLGGRVEEWLHAHMTTADRALGTYLEGLEAVPSRGQ